MRNSWRLTMLLFALTGVVESLAFGHLGAFTPLYLKQLHVADTSIPTWTGLLGALGFVLGLPLLPFWAVWADRYGRKLIIARSAYVEAVLFVLAAFSVNVWMLALARFLTGFVLGNTGIMLAAQAETTPRERLGTAVAIIGAGPVLGQALGPAFGGQFIEHFGIRGLLLLDAGLTMIIALLLTLILREQLQPRATSESVWASIGAAGRNIVDQPLVVRLFALNFLVVLGITTVQPYVPLRIADLYSGPAARLPSTIGLVLTLSGLGMALMTPLWGRLGDRFGFMLVLRLTIIGIVIALVGQTVSAALGPFRDWRIAQGLVQGGVDATIVALIALRVHPERRSAVLNFSRLPAQFAWFLGPLLGATTANFGIPVVFGASAVLVGLGGILSVTLRLSSGSAASATGFSANTTE